MERGARLSGSRFAYLRGDLVLVELALVRYAHGRSSRRRAASRSSRRCWCASGRCTGPGSSRTPSSRSTPCQRTTCIWWARPRWRWPRCTRTRSWPRMSCPFATPGSRAASGARRAPRARTRGGSSASTSSTRSRCSASWSRAGRGRAPAAAGDRGVDHAATPDPLPRGGHRRRRPRRLGRVKKYDIEAWLPGPAALPRADLYSNTTDYQARRLDIRYRPAEGRPTHVATLNGTAVAVGRTIIALLENGQREDGSVALPEALSAGAPPRCCRPRRRVDITGTVSPRVGLDQSEHTPRARIRGWMQSASARGKSDDTRPAEPATERTACRGRTAAVGCRLFPPRHPRTGRGRASSRASIAGSPRSATPSSAARGTLEGRKLTAAHYRVMRPRHRRLRDDAAGVAAELRRALSERGGRAAA